MLNDKDRIAILEAVVYSLKHEIDQYRKTNISIEQLKQLILEYDYSEPDLIKDKESFTMDLDKTNLKGLADFINTYLENN